MKSFSEIIVSLFFILICWQSIFVISISCLYIYVFSHVYFTAMKSGELNFFWWNICVTVKSAFWLPRDSFRIVDIRIFGYFHGAHNEHIRGLKPNTLYYKKTFTLTQFIVIVSFLRA